MKSKTLIESRLLTTSPNCRLDDSADHAGKRAVAVRRLKFLTAVAVLVVAASAGAQSVAVRVQPIRLTVPAADVVTTFSLTNFVDLGTNTAQVTLSMDGLPAGVGYSFDNTVFTADAGGNLTVTTTNVALGEHTLRVLATGDAQTEFLLTLQSARLWQGDTNVVGNWSAPSSWIGGTVPGPGDDVVFTQNGTQTNTIVDGSFFANSVVDTDLEIGSLRFSQTNGTARFHTLQVNPGRTLSVTGTNGFRMLRDATGLSGQMDVTFAGNEGSLVVSNRNANIGILIDNQQSHRLDLSRLGTFVTDVRRIGLGDYRLYPNYDNLSSNGFGGNATFLIPRRFIPTVSLARTNIIRASFADPNNYLDPAIRDYSLTLGNNVIGTTADCLFFLGVTNAFFLDSVCFIQSSAQGDPAAGGVRFNSALAVFTNVVGSVTNYSTNTMTAYFRGTNGGRMSVFALGDAAGIGPSGTGTKAVVNFSGGIIDALVDRLYMGRDRTNSSDGATGEGTMTLAGGTFDVNTAILGFQGQGNNQNTSGADRRSYTRGTLNVNSNTIFRVNNALELGYTTADAGDPSQAELGYGRIVADTGGTVMANTITVGGVTKVSTDNRINLSGGARLVVSNTIASTEKRLQQLNMTDSTLTLHVNGAHTGAYVFVEALTTSGSANVINIASVTGINSFPVQIPLISYVTAAPSLSVTLPDGLSGFIINNTADSTIDVLISDVAPKTVIWRGDVNATWDLATKNWVDANTLTATNFNNGDFAIFDDTGVATSVTVSGSVAPGQSPTVPGITVSNALKNYTFTGGTISGTAKLLKQGAGALAINSTIENSMTVSNGTVNVSGAVGITTVDAGAVLSSSGTVGGVISSGTVSSSGTITGPVSIAGGSFVNSGTVNTTSGTFSVATNAVATNSASGIMNVSGTSTVALGGTFANFGQYNNMTARLNVAGLLFGNGTVSDLTGDANGNNGRLGILSGGTISPGAAPGLIDSFAVEGRFDLNQAGGGNPAGRLVIDIDMNNPATNDLLVVDKWSNIRGTIVMNNIGSIPFAAGQRFLIVSNSFGLPNAPEVANLDYTFEPASPGFGLIWDTSDLVTNGIVRITTTSTDPVPIATSIISTNGALGGSTLSMTWPESHLGWVLQTQSNPLNIGLSNNWTTVLNSRLTNRVDTIITTNNLGGVFYRLVLP